MKILDNFLAEDEFDHIQSYFQKSLPWHYLDHIVGNHQEDPNCFQFVHTFSKVIDPYLQFPHSKHSHINKPILSKLAPWILLKVKANLRPISTNHILSAFHTDLGDLKQLTAIFYLNTCNGYTLFKDGTKIDSIANRILIFPGDLQHCGASCTDQKHRTVLNINYFPGKLNDNSFYIPSDSVCSQPTSFIEF